MTADFVQMFISKELFLKETYSAEFFELILRENVERLYLKQLFPFFLIERRHNLPDELHLFLSA